MIGERTLQGFEIRLRPRDRGRFVTAAFLSTWLCGWAVGEGLALWVLIRGGVALLTGQPPAPGREPLEWTPAIAAGLFLLLWLALWTVGGLAAGYALLSAVWAEDRLIVTGGGLEAGWSRGPFRRRRRFDRDAILGLLLNGRDNHLALALAQERVALSSLGSVEERRRAAAALRAELGIPESRAARPAIPASLEVIVTPEGDRALAPNLAMRRSQARASGLIAMLLSGVALAIGLGAPRDPGLWAPALILLAFALGAAAGTVWLARGRMEWRLGHGRLTLRRRYGDDVRDVLEARALAIESTSDSDGDEWFELFACAAPAGAPEHGARRARPEGRRTLVRLMNDAAPVRDLGRWLEAEAGVTLEDRTSPEAREAERARLRAALEGSGPLGRWVGRQVERLNGGTGAEPDGRGAVPADSKPR